MEYRKLSDLSKLEGNPRAIKDGSFKSLCKSITDNPDYFEARPLILSDRTGQLVIIAGNQRFDAAKHLGLKEVPTHLLSGLTEEREKEIIIRDNVANGEWDLTLLSDWNKEDLTEWGVEVEWANEEESKDKYTQKVDTPIYEPKNEKPEISVLYNADRYKELIAEIDGSTVPEDVKTLLKVAASRHIVFNYENMADFYANSDKEVQTLMENSALVIIDFNRAIELGYVKLRDEIAAQYGEDYGNDE